jgi:hypothetical protein
MSYRSAGKALSIVGLYAALAAWLTWPLAAHLTTHLPDTWPGCRFDTLLIGWTLSHQSRALGGDLSALPDGNIYHPTAHALFHAEAGYGAVPYFLPVYLATENPALATNLMLLGGVVSTAVMLHFVVFRWTGSHVSGLLGAWTFLTTRWVLRSWLPVTPNYAILHYLPLIVFVAARPLSLGGAAVLCVLVVLQGLVSPYLAAATMAPLVVLALARALRRSTRRAAAGLLGVLVLANGVLLAAYQGHVRIRLANPQLSMQSVWASKALWPVPLPWGLLAPDAATAVPTVVLALIALGALGVGLGAWRREPVAAATAWRHGALWAAVGVLACLPPTVRWFGTPIDLPVHQAVERLGVYDLIRFPSRLGVAALVGVAILVGAAFAECSRRLARRITSPVLALVTRGTLALALAVVMYVQYAGGFRLPWIAPMRPLPPSYPIWKSPAPDSRLLAILARARGPVLEVPVGTLEGPDTSNDAPLHARAIYRSIFHRRPVLNGYSSYWPREFPARMAAARRLPDPDALATLRRETGLETILVHPRLFGAVERELCRRLQANGRTAARCGEDFGAAERAMWRRLAAGGGRADLRLVGVAGDDLVFAVAGDALAARPER